MKRKDERQPNPDSPVQEKKYKFLDRFGLKDEKVLFRAGKVLILVLIGVVATMILIQMFNGKVDGWKMAVTGGMLALLWVVETLNLFVAKKKGWKVLCYVVVLTCVFGLVALTESYYVLILYILILTEFYLASKKIRVAALIFGIGVPVYLTAYALVALVLRYGNVDLFLLLSQAAEAIVFLTAHFVAVNFLLEFYRQYLKLMTATRDLDESNARLQKAYDELAEVTALEERQRIAKDIHDTAGHSITTVIMQTEAAKLIVEKDPQEAKKKIVAANLQAKHALEELRESVHLLSGSLGKPTLKTALLEIIAESTDGTDVTIRHSVDDVSVGDRKYRYLCNSLKEGISNGLRHGGATAFYFELKEVEGRIRFLLSDNGKGQEKETVKGFGLTGMEKEAKEFGGEVTFYTEPDEGFEVMISLPIEDNDQAKEEK